jgi:outer membrane protein assembly factor BamD (BamD/ComL family)
VASAPPVAPTDAQGAALPPPDTSPGSSATKPVATKHAPAASSTASDVSSLAAEIAALDRARGPLQSGDASGALHALDDYARAFPHGVMSHEATVLRIEALVKAGNIDAARALAKRFLAQNPKSPHAQRIRRLVGEE